MKRHFTVALSLAVTVLVIACSSRTTPTTNNTTNQSAQTAPTQSSATPETKPAQADAPAGELQPGQASGSYTAKGETVQLKYAYAGRATRFGTESLVVLLTETPIAPESVAEEIKSTPLLEGEKVRGLEYVIDENSMWVRFHPGQYQESGSNKLKDYKLENNVVRAFDDDAAGSLTDGKYKRSVRFAAALTP